MKHDWKRESPPSTTEACKNCGMERLPIVILDAQSTIGYWTYRIGKGGWTAPHDPEPPCRA